MCYSLEVRFLLNYERWRDVLTAIADNGSMSFWDWKSGHRFQALDTTAQPGSLDAEAGIMSSTFDRSGLRLICGEADKTSKFASKCVCCE